jgi:elongation factor G
VLQLIKKQETIIAGMGELHLEIIVDRMKREFNVEANVGKPQVAYRETIMGSADMKVSTSNNLEVSGNYGHVKYQDCKTNGYVSVKKKSKTCRRIPNVKIILNSSTQSKEVLFHKNILLRCEKGFKEGLDRGVLAGFKMVDVSVDLWDGSYHDVDSNEMAFKIASSMAIQDACKISSSSYSRTNDESRSSYSRQVHGRRHRIFLQNVDLSKVWKIEV